MYYVRHPIFIPLATYSVFLAIVLCCSGGSLIVSKLDRYFHVTEFGVSNRHDTCHKYETKGTETKIVPIIGYVMGGNNG